MHTTKASGEQRAGVDGREPWGLEGPRCCRWGNAATCGWAGHPNCSYAGRNRRMDVQNAVLGLTVAVAAGLAAIMAVL